LVDEENAGSELDEIDQSKFELSEIDSLDEELNSEEADEENKNLDDADETDAKNLEQEELNLDELAKFDDENSLENELNSKSYSELESFSPDFGRFLATYKFYKKDEAQRLSSASGGAGDYIFRELFARGLIDYAICAVPADEGDFIAQNPKRDFSTCENLAQLQNLQNSATKNSEQNSAIPNLTQNLADDDSINFTSAQNSFCENFTQNSAQNFTNENFAQNSKASCKNSVSAQNFACENSKNARNYAGENSAPLFKFRTFAKLSAKFKLFGAEFKISPLCHSVRNLVAVKFADKIPRQKADEGATRLWQDYN